MELLLKSLFVISLISGFFKMLSLVFAPYPRQVPKGADFIDLMICIFFLVWMIRVIF